MTVRSEFFEGLSGEDVLLTLNEYNNAGFAVVAFGYNEDGYWVVLQWSDQ